MLLFLLSQAHMIILGSYAGFFDISRLPSLAQIMKSLLVFDSAYPVEAIQQLGLEANLEALDPGQIFDQICIVNLSTAALMQSVGGSLFGKPHITKFSSKIVFCEPKFGRFNFLFRFKKLNFFLSMLSFYSIMRRLNSEYRFSLVRAEDPSINGLFGLLTAKILRVPLIVGIWGDPSRIRSETKKPLSQRFFKFLYIESAVEKFVLLRSRAVLVQNFDNSLYPRGIGVRPECIHVLSIGLWVNKKFLEFTNMYNLEVEKQHTQSTAFSFFCVSRLEPSKHIEDLIVVAKILKKRNYLFKLSLIGAGSQAEYLQNLVDREGLGSYVLFLGTKSQAWMLENLGKYHLGLCPLIGRALLEGALMGIPFVGYDIDWHSELVLNDKSGYLVPPGDYSSFADAIIRICENPGLRAEFSKNIRQLSLHKMRENISIGLLNSIYLELIQKK